MIATDMRPHTFFTIGEPNEYGMSVVSDEPKGVIKMAIYINSQSVVDNIKYKDATYVGLTADTSVDDTYIIDYLGVKLKVLYVNPQGRYKQVWMTEL